MNLGRQTVGMQACNWLRLDVKEGEQAPNVRIYSSFELQEGEALLRRIFEL